MSELTAPMARLSAGLRESVPTTDQWLVYEELGNVTVEFSRKIDGKSFHWRKWLSGYMLTDAAFDLESFGRWTGEQWDKAATEAETLDAGLRQ